MCNLFSSLKRAELSLDTEVRVLHSRIVIGTGQVCLDRSPLRVACRFAALNVRECAASAMISAF